MEHEMKSVTTGSRTELLTELARLKEGWEHGTFYNEKLSKQAADGMYDLTRGCSSTQVGHTRYEVTGETE